MLRFAGYIKVPLGTSARVYGEIGFEIDIVVYVLYQCLPGIGIESIFPYEVCWI
jgi:hypothetical protein